MEKEYYNGNNDFLDNIVFQQFKPNKDLICCSDLMLNVLGGSISNNFIEPIKKLYNHYKCVYYENLLLFVESNEDKFKIPIKINKDNNMETKEIIFHYLESNIKYNMIISIGKANKVLESISEITYELNNLNINQMIGIIFQIDIQKNKINTYDYYYNKVNDNTSLYFYYILNTNKIDNINDNIFILDNFNSIREISQVLFNDLSLEVLSLTRFDRIISKQFYETFYNHQIYKRFLYSKVKTIDQIRFILFSCSVLFTLGNTYCQDIDLLVYDENASSEVKMVVNKYFVENNFKLIDFHMKGYGDWTIIGKKSYLNDWFVKEWHNLFGSKNFEETTFNPKFHYYFLGMKFISYQADIIRRVKRNRATAYTDLIMLDYFNGLIIKPFKLERKYWENNTEKTYSNEDLKQMIIKILKNIVRWHNIKIDAKRVYNYILFPSDFKLYDNELDDIDILIDNWINKNKIRIDKKCKENNQKINLIIESYKK